MAFDVSIVPSYDFYEPPYSDENASQYLPNRDLKLHGYNAGIFSAYAVLLAIGSIGNFWVITVIGRLLRQARSESPRAVQIYIFAICCCDLLALSFLSLLLLDLAYGHWMIPAPWLCKLYMTSESITKFGAPFLLTCLTSFCYMTICKHQNNTSANKINTSRFKLKPTSPKFAILLVCGCAILVSGLVTPIYMYSNIYYVIVRNGSIIHRVMPKCALQPPEGILTAFTIYSFALGYIIPSVLVTYFYASVLYYVRKNAKWMRAERSQRFWRVAKTSMGLVGFYLACWTPYWVMSLYYYFTPHTTSAGTGGRSLAGIVLSYFLHMLPYINCGGYPLLYTLLNRRIRDDYTKAKAVSRDRKRRRQLASTRSRASIFSNGSVSTAVGVQPITPGPFAWLWALSNRQRHALYAMRKIQRYPSPESNGHSLEITSNTADDSTSQHGNSLRRKCLTRSISEK